MAKHRIRIPPNRSQEYRHFILQKYRIEKHCPFLNCTLHRNHLMCRGSIIPSEGCDTYDFTISYVMGGIPSVYITNPRIPPRAEYHIYKEGCLCLYDWREMPWRAKMNVHETIIPWTAEWAVFYELWRLTGQWLGAASSHGVEDKKAETVNRQS